MKGHTYRYYGSLLVYIGVIMVLTHTIIVMFLYRNPITFSRLFFTPYGFIIRGFLPLGLILTCSGVIIRNRFSEGNSFLTKDGEPIHLAKPWYQGPESGLFLTSCGLVLSINQESRETAHVGYRIVPAQHATHRDCAVKEGTVVLDSASKRRSC